MWASKGRMNDHQKPECVDAIPSGHQIKEEWMPCVHPHTEPMPPNKTLGTLVTHVKPSLLRLVPSTLGLRRPWKGLTTEKALTTRKSVHNHFNKRSKRSEQ